EVEARVVHPHGPSAVDRRRGELVAIAGNKVQTHADLLEQFTGAGRRAFDDRQAADVHVRVLALLVQERGVDRRQPVEMARRHERLAYRHAPYNGSRVQYGREARAGGATGVLRGL